MCVVLCVGVCFNSRNNRCHDKIDGKRSTVFSFDCGNYQWVKDLFDSDKGKGMVVW